MERRLFLSVRKEVKFLSAHQFCPDTCDTDKRRWRIKKIILASVLSLVFINSVKSKKEGNT
jgi:hypothetical protein